MDASDELLCDPTGALHERLGAERPCLCLVRPDGHLGLRAEPHLWKRSRLTSGASSGPVEHDRRLCVRVKPTIGRGLLRIRSLPPIANSTSHVLILGRFTDERKAVLDALREELRRRDYTPVLFDFEKPRSRSTLETVSTLAHMARFVIADLNGT